MKHIARGRLGGFTLIELLVVVLIIGILASIALPQYERAVWKSRASSMLSNVRSLAQAQEVYYLSQNEYPKNFDELDISFDNLPYKKTGSSVGLGVLSSNAIRANDYYELVLNHNSNWRFSTAMFYKGPYTGGGFAWSHQSEVPNQVLYCIESTRYGTPGKFCKLYGGTKVATRYEADFYQMP